MCTKTRVKGNLPTRFFPRTGDSLALVVPWGQSSPIDHTAPPICRPPGTPLPFKQRGKPGRGVPGTVAYAVISIGRTAVDYRRSDNCTGSPPNRPLAAGEKNGSISPPFKTYLETYLAAPWLESYG